MPYKKTDKVIDFLTGKYIKIFRKLKLISNFDELNVIQLTHDVYDEAEKITQQEMLRLAEIVYKQTREQAEPEMETSFGIEWLLAVLGEYNPVTRYIYLNEVERKRAKLAEAIIATSSDKLKVKEEVNRALRMWAGMNKQLADDITLAAMIQAITDDGYEYVEWITYKDDKRCGICKKMDGQIFRIDSIPPRPHNHCRCYVRGVIND